MFILFFLASLAFAETSDMRTLTEKTFTRDSTYCKINDKRVQFQIRSESRYTEPKEKPYGDLFFYYPKEEQAKLLPLNHDKLNSFRLFEGESSLCSKSLAFMIKKNQMAILFLKENRPYKDLLTIMLYNTKKNAPVTVVETKYPTDKAELHPEGFVFNTFAERDSIDMGKVKIGELEYTYQDRDFPIWAKYTEKGFELLAPVTFQKFQWNKHFKTQDEFNAKTGWDAKEKNFKNTTLYVAVNHKKKKTCILFSPTKLNLTGTETDWNCL